MFNQEANQHKPSNKTMPTRSRIPATSGNLARPSNVAAVPADTYIWVMSRSAPSSVTPDLFDYLSSTPAQRIQRTLPDVKRSVPELGQLSDARLAGLLHELTSEFQRRKAESTGRESRPELD